MNREMYATVAGELMAAAGSIEDSKRPGYTIGSDDILANFKRAGAAAGVTAAQAWAVFFLKHVDAIVSIMTRPDLPVSEAAEGRFADAINYLRLGYAMHREANDWRHVEAPAAKPAQLEADIEAVRDDSDHTHYVPAGKIGAVR